MRNAHYHPALGLIDEIRSFIDTSSAKAQEPYQQGHCLGTYYPHVKNCNIYRNIYSIYIYTIPTLKIAIYIGIYIAYIYSNIYIYIYIYMNNLP